MKPSILLFNTVERLMRGDFFHATTPELVREELAAFPSHWSVIGLGTTNWYNRNGELLVVGTASQPCFLWADPAEPSKLIDLERSALEGLRSPACADREGRPYFPFAAVAVWGPSARAVRMQLRPGTDVHVAIEATCDEHNIGLAALRVTGWLEAVEYQVMCHIPLGGIAEDRPPSAHLEHEGRSTWEALGFYAANPTIRSMLAHESVAVHLHARTDRPDRGGHLNHAVAASDTYLEVVPLNDLTMRIHDLERAFLPVNALAS